MAIRNLKKSQIKDVLAFMRENGSITSMQAFEKFHITRLAGIIYRLRKYGYDIDTQDNVCYTKYGICNYAVYILNESEEIENG